jgi:hypothetical protein
MVDPDDLLIFKLRAKAKQVPNAAERPSAGVQAVTPPEAARQQAGSSGTATAESQGARSPAEHSAGEVVPETQFRYIQEDQGQVSFPITAKPAGAEKEGIRGYSYIAGTLFMISAVIFGYFIYPQFIFLLSYISNVGLAGFLGAINYDYGMAAINVALVALSAVCGALMFASPEKAHRFSGIVSSAVILVVTFEYLNSNAGNLIVVIVLAFFEIGLLAYVSMTASSRAFETESLGPEELMWPRAETF